MEKYPRMYSISQQQHHFVQQLGVASLGGWDWQLQWRRLLREAEIDIAAKFMKDIEGVVVQANQFVGLRTRWQRMHEREAIHGAPDKI